MNRKTTPAVIDALYSASRERYRKDENKQDGYALIERDIRTINEMNWFEKKADGTLGAIEGQKDDLVDATGGVFYIATEKMPLPRLIEKSERKEIRKPKSEASF